jgi:hypothetical protein
MENLQVLAQSVDSTVNKQSAPKKKKPNKLTADDLAGMAHESDKRVIRIEDEHKDRVKYIKSMFTDKELVKELAKEDRNYYGKKAENERRTKEQIEIVQRSLLDIIQTQYEAEQQKIMKEYNVFESKAKDTFYNKENENKKNYSFDLNELVRKYNSLIRKHILKHEGCDLQPIPIFDSPTVDTILKTAKITGCEILEKFDSEFKESKNKLHKEYTKTKASWDSGSQIYHTLKDLDSDYNSRCTRYRYKYNIERFEHINGCQKCSTIKFSYIPYLHANKEPEQLKAYFHKHINNDKWCMDCDDPIIYPSECTDGSKIMCEFSAKFSKIFYDYLGLEIQRIRNYEISVPKEQNLTFTVLYAEKVWTKIKSKKILDLNYNRKTDDEKIDMFRKDEDKFYKDFPIVARYMICTDNYNRVAFKKFLIKLIENNKIKAENERLGTSKEGDAEDKWIELQADYVKYLYQECHKTKHLSPAEVRHVWKETYELLKKEFGDFRKLYDKKVKDLESEKKTQTAQVAKDLIDRLTTTQSIDEETQYKLYIEMQDTLFLQRANKNIISMMLKVPKNIIGIEGKGRNTEIKKMMEKDKKIKEAKAKFDPEAQIKNPIKYHYDNVKASDEKIIFNNLRDLCYLNIYHDVQYQLACHLKHMNLNSYEIEAYGTNIDMEAKWIDERKKWIDERKNMENPEQKIHIPYTRNLVKMYYDNGERFEIN